MSGLFARVADSLAKRVHKNMAKEGSLTRRVAEWAAKRPSVQRIHAELQQNSRLALGALQTTQRQSASSFAHHVEHSLQTPLTIPSASEIKTMLTARAGGGGKKKTRKTKKSRYTYKNKKVKSKRKS